jgi:hypothetical protein
MFVFMNILEKFIKQVENRSLENQNAFNLLYENECYGVCIGIIRQELDSLLRVSYLIEFNGWCFNEFAFELVKNSVESGEWRYLNNNKFKRVTDKEMLDKGGWESIVYDFGCGLIHLSNKHSYKHNSILNISQNEKEKIIDYMKKYHDFDKTDVDMNDIVEYLPRIYKKIRENIDYYLEEIVSINKENRIFE